MKKIIALLLVFTFLLTLMNGTFSIAEERIILEEKEYCSATLDQDFDDSCVLVVMDKNVSGINKKFDKSFFGDLPIESVVD